LDEYPQIAASARYHVRTGDDLSRYFGLLMAEYTGAEWLAAEAARLVTGNVLRKDRRIQAMRFLADNGEMVLEEETPKGSKTQTIRVHEFEISREPTGETPPEVKALVTKAYWFLREGDGARAERLLRKALKTREDQPAIWQNLGVAYEMQGRDDKALKTLEQTYRRFPDYAFARFAVAVRLARKEGKIKEALELLQPIMEQRKYHVSEFTALCHTMVLIHMADKKFDAALQWLDMWKDVEPNDPRLEELTILDGYRAVKELAHPSRNPKTRKPATPKPTTPETLDENREGQLPLL
jgi:hypothetical protein